MAEKKKGLIWLGKKDGKEFMREGYKGKNAEDRERGAFKGGTRSNLLILNKKDTDKSKYSQKIAMMQCVVHTKRM